MLMYTVSYVFTRNDDNSMNLQAISYPTYENQMMDIPERDVDNNYCELNMNTADDHTYTVYQINLLFRHKESCELLKHLELARNC